MLGGRHQILPLRARTAEPDGDANEETAASVRRLPYI